MADQLNTTAYERDLNALARWGSKSARRFWSTIIMILGGAAALVLAVVFAAGLMAGVVHG